MAFRRSIYFSKGWIYCDFRPPQEPRWPITNTDLIFNWRHHFTGRLKRKTVIIFRFTAIRLGQGTLLLIYSWRWWWYWDNFTARITQTWVLFCWFIETVVTTGGNDRKRKKSGHYTSQSALHSRYCIYSNECRAVRYILGPVHIIPEKFWRHTYIFIRLGLSTLIRHRAFRKRCSNWGLKRRRFVLDTATLQGHSFKSRMLHPFETVHDSEALDEVDASVILGCFAIAATGLPRYDLLPEIWGRSWRFYLEASPVCFANATPKSDNNSIGLMKR